MKGKKKILQDEIEEKGKLKDKNYNIPDKNIKNIKKSKKLNKDFLLNKKVIFFSIIVALFIFAQIKLNILNLKKEKNNINSNVTMIDDTRDPSDPSEEIKKVKIAIYAHSIANGGIERLTALLANYLSTKAIFDVYLFLNKDCKDEYKLNENIHRVKIKIHSTQLLRRRLIENQIEVFIYQFYIVSDIKMLNKLSKTKDIKTIFYNHSSFLYWIYDNNFHFFRTLYNAYRESNYIVSLIPLENDFLFKNWGINSVLMDNLMPYNYSDITPSDLSSKTILMIGRGSDKMKRFDLGIKAMKYIVKEVPDCEMKIISETDGVDDLIKLIKKLNLENNVKFEGYTSSPEKYYKNASIHLFPSITESFGLVLSETKLYGIPNILVGLDYVSCAKGGVSIIYDDKPESIAKEAIKILKNETYRKKLGKKARESMKAFDNEATVKRWERLILSIYLEDIYYHRFKALDTEKIKKKQAMKILQNQVNLLRMRIDKMKNVTVDDLLNFSYMENLYKLKRDGIYYFKHFF